MKILVLLGLSVLLSACLLRGIATDAYTSEEELLAAVQVECEYWGESDDECGAHKEDALAWYELRQLAGTLTDSDALLAWLLNRL